MPSTRDQRLEELFQRWEEHSLQGDTLSAEDLCRDNPELLDDLRERIHDSARLVDVAHATTIRQGITPCVMQQAATDWPRIDGYEILEELGHGGMGFVYKALQVRADRLVALKVIRHRGLASRHDIERFDREVKALAAIRHPNLVQVHDVGEQDGEPYFTMEYFPAGNLHTKIGGRPQDPRESASLVEALARAVQAAHDAGVIHRDLKPSNVLLAADGSPRIADFGLAKRLEGNPLETPSGIIIGTPCYMSPEQAAARKDVGPAADVYALGAILYECLTGRPPFRGETPTVTVIDVLSKPVTPPRSVERGIPPVLEAICLKCLEKDPARRFQSAGELADDLERWARGASTRARPPRLVARIAVALGRRWRPALATATVLLFLVSFLVFAAHVERAGQGKAERARARLLAELARGKSVALLDPADGTPHWLDWPLGSGEIFRGPPGKGLFSFQAGKLCAARLLEGPGIPAYRFEALVRDETNDSPGEVGLFIALVGHRSDAGNVQLLACWFFTDSLSLTQQGNVPRLTFFLCRNLDAIEEAGQRLSRRECGASRLRFQPVGAGPRPRPWRSLAVEVSANGLEGFWEGQRALQVTRAQIDEVLRAYAQSFPGLPEGWLQFDPAGGLGLVVFQGTGSFKDVVVTPRSH